MDSARLKKTANQDQEVSKPRFDKSIVVRNPDSEDDFFRNYQLFRNAIVGNRLGVDREIYNVFIYPGWNTKCVKEFENFKKNFVVDTSRVLSLEWAKIVPNEMAGL